jgi:hypothetical protein
MKIEIINKKEIKIIGMFQTVKILEKKNFLYAQVNMIRPNFNKVNPKRRIADKIGDSK